jgi:hypothetical protein
VTRRPVRTLTRNGPIPPHTGLFGWFWNWLDRTLYRIAGH